MDKATCLFWYQTSNVLAVKELLLHVITPIHRLIVVTSRMLVSIAPHVCMGGVQVHGGSEPRSGQVELCWMGGWVTICENDCSNETANVVCRQLGYSGFGK